jgi:hypothetical protein
VPNNEQSPSRLREPFCRCVVRSDGAKCLGLPDGTGTFVVENRAFARSVQFSAMQGWRIPHARSKGKDKLPNALSSRSQEQWQQQHNGIKKENSRALLSPSSTLTWKASSRRSFRHSAYSIYTLVLNFYTPLLFSWYSISMTGSAFPIPNTSSL